MHTICPVPAAGCSNTPTAFRLLGKSLWKLLWKFSSSWIKYSAKRLPSVARTFQDKSDIACSL